MKIIFKTNIKKINIENELIKIELYGKLYNYNESIKLLKSVKNKKELLEVIKKISGIWFIKAKINDEVILVSDIVGGLRVYYTVYHNTFYLFTKFSDRPYDRIKINECEKIFWDRHSYTTGIGTLDERIKKFPPASFLALDIKQSLKNLTYKDFDIYLEDKENNPNDIKLKDNVFSDLEKTMKNLKGKTVLLGWSGGLDSNLLAILLKEYKIDFIPFYLSFYPKDNDFLSDDYKVKKMSNILNINPFYINIDIKKLNIPDEVIENNLNDKHWGFYIFGKLPVDIILKKYNLKKENIVLLSGQSSDSIFTWGISWKAFGGILQRYLIVNFLKSNKLKQKILSNFYTFIFNKKWHLDNFKVPSNEKYFKIGLFDNKTYLPLINFIKTDEEVNYHNYLWGIISDIDSKLKYYYPRMMYYKYISHLASAPNYSWTYHLNYGIDVVLPFSTPRIINSVLEHQDFNKMIMNPRYILFDIAKDLKIPTNDLKISLKGVKSKDNALVKDLLKQINNKWNEKLNEEKY